MSGELLTARQRKNMNNNYSIYAKLSYGLYNKSDYNNITDNYVIHEYDLHHKDLPVYAYYDSLAERRSAREMKEYDVKKEFKNVKMTKEKILEKLRYKKNKTALRHVISLTEILKYVTERDSKVHSINLSCVSATLLSMFNYQVRAHRAIQYCKKVGLLKEVDSFYVFNPKRSKSRHVQSVHLEQRSSRLVDRIEERIEHSPT